MPELFVEISPELAQEKGIKNLDWCKISSPRTQVRAKALVTRRMRAFTIGGKIIHQVGTPWHWGYEGLTTGDIVQEDSPNEIARAIGEFLTALPDMRGRTLDEGVSRTAGS